MRVQIVVAAVLASSFSLVCASGQLVMLQPVDVHPPTTSPGRLPMEDPGEVVEIVAIATQDSSLSDVLATVAERDGLNIIAEVYPGTEWARARDVTVPAGECRRVLVAVAEAYDCEYGTLHGTHIFRKQRPWEHPEIGPEVDDGPVEAKRLVWDGQKVCDVVAELSCRRARLALVVRRLAEWRTPGLGPYFQGRTTHRHLLVHPDFEERRIFAHIRDMPESEFEPVLAACAGAVLTGADSVVLARSPGMAWRGALADYEENGPPDFEQYVRSLDPAYLPAAERIRPQDLLLLELLRSTGLFEARRLLRGVPLQAKLRELRDLAPVPIIAQEYPTVTFGFEELPRIAQLAVVACIKENDAQADAPHRHFNAERPDRIIVTLTRVAAAEGKLGRLHCTVSYPMRDGVTMVR